MSGSGVSRANARRLLVAGLALWLSGEAFGVVVLNRIRLENSRQTLTFVRGKKRDTDTTGGMGLQSILDLASGARVSTVFSPIFQLELRSLDPLQFPPLRVPAGDINFTILPIEQVELVMDPVFSDTVRMTWSNIPVTNSTQLAQVVVRVGLRPSDGKAVWRIDATMDSSGPYGIYAVRFPYLALNVINADGSDDNFLIPMTGGQVVPNPLVTGNNHAERGPDEGATDDAYFTYPGNVMTQFMALYDSTFGVYMAAEDTTGKTKNLSFNQANTVFNPAQVRVYSYFTHFNTVPAPIGNETTQQLARQLQNFSLVGDLNYSVVTDVFAGDWLDATNIYRNWVVGSNAPWIGRGPLETRGDIPNNISQTAYAIRWQISPTPDNVQPIAEAIRVQQALAFYESVRDLYDPNRDRDFVPLALLSQAQITPEGVLSIGQGDDVAEPLRVGVPEFIRLLHNPPVAGFPVRAIAMNRDTTGIETDSPNAPEALVKGVMRKSDLGPIEGRPDIWRTCLASSWILNRRTNIFLQTIQESFFGGFPGFTMAAVTGTGNFGFCCYSPLEDDPLIADRTEHNHDIGGGNYLTAGWFNLALTLKTGAAALGLPFLLLGMEHTPETMINQYILVGRSFSEPYDDTQHGVFRTITGATPVPLFKFLYHDFNVWPANPPFMTEVVDTYVDALNPLASLLLVRFRIGQLAMHGRLLKYRLALNSDYVTYDGPPNTLPPEVQDEHRYFAALATLRAHVPQYLAFGQARRDPEILPETAADSVPIRFIRLGVESTIREPRILTSAWSDSMDLSVGLVFTNFTPQSSRCSFTFKPADYELSPGTNYKIQKNVGLGLWVDMPGWEFNGSDPSVTFGPMTVVGMEELNGPPWSVYRIVGTVTPL